jgi:2-polyprenyl-6-hydroxyphenyl methylase/3-demethylubiquinone-9 3-methyltransferase
VNNSFYDGLGDRWYSAYDDPVALLRAESACRAPWVAGEIRKRFGEHGEGRPARVLDVGCGAGFLTNELARQGHRVTGVDAAPGTLATAERHDTTRSVRYTVADALRLPFDDGSFDVVCAMDFLEHVEQPAAVIAEVARVLAPGGQFFFHTFNRNVLAWLIVIKGVEWFVKNTPRDMHVLRLFLTPREVSAMCEENRLKVQVVRGLRPVVFSTAFLRLLLTRVVPPDFRFRFVRSTLISYTGVAFKEGASP